MIEYKDLTMEDLGNLNREMTVFLMAVSPLEVHGPHLPVGTDVIISEELLQRYSRRLGEEFPDHQLVRLPSLYTGANALPEQGSISIRARTLENLIFDFGRGLAEQGFCYLFLADNHGGPGHQLALEAAGRKLWKKYNFHLVNPFGLVYRYMVQHDPKLLELVSLGPGDCGDDADNHAGTNETSLMLAVEEERAGNYRKIGPAYLPRPGFTARLLKMISRIIARIGGEVLAADLKHLANLLAWINDPERRPYLGDPGAASKEAGERMLAARTEIAMTIFGRILALNNSEPYHPEIEPVLWQVRFLRWFA